MGAANLKFINQLVDAAESIKARRAALEVERSNFRQTLEDNIKALQATLNSL